MLDSLGLSQDHMESVSTDDAEALTLHTVLSHLEHMCVLFVDYILASKTIVPLSFRIELQDLGLNSSLCSWSLNLPGGKDGQHHLFLTGPPGFRHQPLLEEDQEDSKRLHPPCNCVHSP